MPKGISKKRNTPEFEEMVVKRIQEEKLTYSEAERGHGFAAGNRSIAKSCMAYSMMVFIRSTERLITLTGYTGSGNLLSSGIEKFDQAVKT